MSGLIGVVKNIRNFYTQTECFVLQIDNWNDFSFRTQYQLFHVNFDKRTFIGSVKILSRGQTADGIPRLTESFKSLSADYISIGQSLDYYQRLLDLPNGKGKELLRSLSDITLHPQIEKSFAHESGLVISLFREIDNPNQFIHLAKSLANGLYTSLANEDFKFKLTLPGWARSINFDFSDESKPSSNTIIPSNIYVLTGTNGAGKSTLLSRLARIAYATQKQRRMKTLQALGRISPQGIGFTRIITVSYSAFDSFRLPGVKPTRKKLPDERAQIVQDMQEGGGRFIFCGLRDIAAEYEKRLDEELDFAYSTEAQGLYSDRDASTVLKPIEQIANEFKNTLDRLKNRGPLAKRILERALDCIRTDPSFTADEYDLSASYLFQCDAIEVYLGWSTGIKIVMQIIISLCANVTRHSLVLIDEPEMHLHPPLLAALMHAIRKILEAENAHAIVSTHSPVVIQETLARNVYHIRREGNLCNYHIPEIETFGENVGTLTAQVFGLTTETKDFYRILDILARKYNDLEKIEVLFKPYGLSVQARSYLMSALASEN
ncbi:AAA family ATPase [Pseudomonas viridiflava]|uniref:AAA family ATPase n=1 Tax=Pseudomonas viridiflava TaxID=33069 RepID=UPI000F040B8E|nr:AAA family ATPase [Pseudomonas viridiflava]